MIRIAGNPFDRSSPTIGVLLIISIFLFSRFGFAENLDEEHYKALQQLSKTKTELDLAKTRYLEKKAEFENPDFLSKYIGEPIAHGLEKDMLRRKAVYDELLWRYQTLNILVNELEAWKEDNPIGKLLEDAVNFIDDESKAVSSGTVSVDKTESW